MTAGTGASAVVATSVDAAARAGVGASVTAGVVVPDSAGSPPSPLESPRAARRSRDRRSRCSGISVNSYLRRGVAWRRHALYVAGPVGDQAPRIDESGRRGFSAVVGDVLFTG